MDGIMTEVDNLFDTVEQLIKASKSNEALLMILNDGNNRIIKPFNLDLNHSWYLVGLAYFEKENFEKALKAFKKAYKHRKEDLLAIRQIGICYSELDNPKMAKFYYSKAIKNGENGEIIFYNLGNAYFDMGKFELAIEEYRKISKIGDVDTYNLAQRNISHANYNLGNIYFDQSKYDLAIELYLKVKKTPVDTYSNAQANIKASKEKQKKILASSRNESLS